MTAKPTRLLRSRDEIRAAGREHGKTLAPLTEAQVNVCAAILAPVFTASATADRLEVAAT